MMRRIWLAVFLSLALAAAPGGAQNPPGPAAPDEAALLAELQARSPIVFNAARRGPEPNAPIVALFGDLFDAQGGGKPATVKAFVEKYGSLLGFPPGPPPGELQAQPEGKREKGETLTYVPVNGGVKYHAGAVTFGFAPDGKLLAANGRFKSAAAAQMGGLTAEDAARRGLVEMAKKLPGAWLTGNGTLHESLEDTPDGSAIRRVFRVRAQAGAKRAPLKVSLGPDGEVLEFTSSAENGDAVGKVYPAYPNSTEGDGALNALSWTATTFGWGLYGPHFEADSSAGFGAVVDDSGRADYKPEWFTIGTRVFWNPRWMEVNVYHHLMKARDKAVELGAKEVDDTKIKFDVYFPKTSSGNDANGNPQYGATIDNAFYNGVDRIAFASENPGLNHVTPAIDASVIYHEYAHYICRALNASFDQGGTNADWTEVMALGEGWSDAFASTLTGQPHVMVQWTNNNAGYVRDATTPHTAGKKYCDLFPTEYGTTQPAGFKSEGHTSGELLGSLAWEMKDQCFGGDANWLMRRMIWAMRDTSGPVTMHKFCLSMLLDEVLYGHITDPSRARLIKMRDLMEAKGLYNKACPP